MTYYLLKVEPCWLVKFSSVFASSHPVCFNFCCETTIFSRFFPTRESGPELKWSSVLGKSNLLQSKNWVYQKRQKKIFQFFFNRSCSTGKTENFPWNEPPLLLLHRRRRRRMPTQHRLPAYLPTYKYLHVWGCTYVMYILPMESEWERGWMRTM